MNAVRRYNLAFPASRLTPSVIFIRAAIVSTGHCDTEFISVENISFR